MPWSGVHRARNRIKIESEELPGKDVLSHQSLEPDDYVCNFDELYFSSLTGSRRVVRIKALSSCTLRPGTWDTARSGNVSVFCVMKK